MDRNAYNAVMTEEAQRKCGMAYKRLARAARTEGKLNSAKLYEMYSRRAYRGTLGVVK